MTALWKMCANHLLPVRFLPSWSQFCNANLCSIIKRQTLSTACISSRTLARITSHSVSYNIGTQCHHPWKSKQSNSVCLKAVSYSSAITDSEPNSECNQEKPDRKRRKVTMSNNIRKERRENQSVINDIIARKADTTWTDDDWVSLAENLQSTGKDLWEVTCMHTFYESKNTSVARSLMTYLEAQEKSPSLIVLTFYIGLLGETSSGSEDQANETYKYYLLLMSRTDVLDAASIEVLISGLSMTKYYHECVKLLKICKETSSPSAGSLVKLLKAGLRNQDANICKSALTSYEENLEPTTFNPFVPKIIEECLAVNNQQGLNLVMNFIQKHRLLINKQALEDVTEIFHRYQPNQWSANYGFIFHKTGCCSVCGHQMKRSEVSDEDFRSIQSAFLDQVIVGKNVFFKSSPDEVDKFVKYVQKKGPFDVVIDSLNILYRGQNKPSQQQLLKAVEYFTSLKMKVLLLGSKMLSLHIPTLKNVLPRPDIYLTSTTKADDAFFLYAALHSGKNTLVVSSDKLRDHKFLLDTHLRHIFYQWILTSQVSNSHVTKFGEFKMGRRHLYDIGPVRDDEGWHIPEMDIDAVNPFGKLSVLCLRNKISQNVYHQKDTAENRSFRKNLTQVVSPEIDMDQVRPSQVRQKQKHLARHNKSKTGNMGTSKTDGKTLHKVKPSNGLKSENDKEWFDN